MNILINEYTNGGKHFENNLIDRNSNDYKDLLLVFKNAKPV